MAKLSKHQMTLWEVLTEINDNPMTLRDIYRPIPGSALSLIFLYAFMPQVRWKFPDTDPPYTPSDLGAGMTPTDLLVAIKRGRLKYFDPRYEMNQVAREKIFIQLLESVHSGEAKILLAIKDQRLDSLFPNITHDLLVKAGYLPPGEDLRKKVSTPAVVEKKPEEVAVVEDNFQVEQEAESEEKPEAPAETPAPAPVKRGRGRPKKVQSEGEDKPKRPRGRPRKVQDPA